MPEPAVAFLSNRKLHVRRNGSGEKAAESGTGVIVQVVHSKAMPCGDECERRVDLVAQRVHERIDRAHALATWRSTTYWALKSSDSASKYPS